MTMIKNEQLKHGQQEKWFNNFHENLDLNVTAQEREQQPDLRWELLENCSSQYSELSGKTEKHRDSISLEAQQQGNQIPQTKISEACVNDLLILAQSAEIVAQSEDSMAGVHTNNQKNKDLQSDLIDRMSQEHASNINVDVTRTRLTQIRKQARCKYLKLDQERADDSRCKHSQVKTIRLNQIKHQARCKSKNDLVPQMISRAENDQPKGRILRLSQLKNRARSKGNSTVKDGNEKHMDQSLPCNRFKDNEQVIAGQVVKKNIFPVEETYVNAPYYVLQLMDSFLQSCNSSLEVHDSSASVEDVPAHNFRGPSQSSVVRRDIENLKEHQRIARRLRAFKTKKLRQQFRRECKRNVSKVGLHAMGTSLTGLTGIRVNFGNEKLQGYPRTEESSALECKSLEHTPNQNSLLTLTSLPNNIFHKCDTSKEWMLYMNHMHLKEYHRVVACQHRAECVEEKRASNVKKKNNPALANSEAQKEFVPVKRLRLSQLRREARLGNPFPAMQGLPGN